MTAPPGFLKGQLHAHSSGSQDSATSPIDVHRWYEAHGFDFLVFTDHNFISDTPDTKLITIPGAELTKNLRACNPPPPPHGRGCTLHTNALFVASGQNGPVEPLEPIDPKSDVRRDVYRQELARVTTLGAIAQLNHPNLLFSGADEPTVVDLASQGVPLLLEIRNEAWDSENDGDATHPSTEALWDAALTRGAHVFGTATDDAHHYLDASEMRARGERPFDGDRGYVMVRAEKTTSQIREAVARGDFYASTGIVFTRYDVDRDKGAFAIESAGPVIFEVIAKSQVIREARGTKIEVTIGPDDGPYLRVRARRDHDSARAFTQPVFRTKGRAPQ